MLEDRSHSAQILYSLFLSCFFLNVTISVLGNVASGKYESVRATRRIHSVTCTGDCRLDFGYNTPAPRILHLQGSLFSPFKKPEVRSVTHGKSGCLDHFSVDNSKGKLTQL